jgi:hypothetical protein
MKNPELDSVLKQARLPEIPEESLALFPRRIVARLKSDDSPIRVTRNLVPRLAWAFGLAACVVAAFGIGRWHGRMESETAMANDSLANLKLIRETLAMFPNRVRAIVQDEHGLNLVLAEADDVPASSPLYIRICDGKHCASLVTFSGQEIQVAGQKITVLADAHGGIILTGNHFAWSSSEPTALHTGLTIVAKSLGPAVM